MRYMSVKPRISEIPIQAWGSQLGDAVVVVAEVVCWSWVCIGEVESTAEEGSDREDESGCPSSGPERSCRGCTICTVGQSVLLSLDSVSCCESVVASCQVTALLATRKPAFVVD